jgi:hypothetical protein
MVGAPGRRVDVAVLPIPFKLEEIIISLYPLNVLANAALRIEIGMEVFILGYPFEIKPPAYPVWKRGSIASEPQLARLTTDYMLVDTASRPGMSGAPVIRRSWTNHMVEPGVVALVDTPINRFIGVYSGRVPTDHPHEAQIGLVWEPYTSWPPANRNQWCGATAKVAASIAVRRSPSSWRSSATRMSLLRVRSPNSIHRPADGGDFALSAGRR